MTTMPLNLAIDEQLLDDLAEQLAERISQKMHERLADSQGRDRWMPTAEAARYTGRSISAMHRLTAARAIPFHQTGPGAKCYFRKSDLDAWMES